MVGPEREKPLPRKGLREEWARQDAYRTFWLMPKRWGDEAPVILARLLRP